MIFQQKKQPQQNKLFQASELCAVSELWEIQNQSFYLRYSEIQVNKYIEVSIHFPKLLMDCLL